MENENNSEPQFAGTLNLEEGTATKGGAEPVFTDDPNAVLNPPAEPLSGEPPATQPVETPPAVVPPVTTPNDWLKNWNERAGTQFQTEDEAIEEIKSSRGLKEKLTDYEKRVQELAVLDDPFVRDIAKAKKAGIGIELYLDAVKMDVDKLETKSALKEAYMRRNAELVATDPEFAGMKFERDYQAKYGKIGEILDVSGLEEFEAKEKTLEFNREQDFIKRSLNAEAIQDKKYLSEWKKQHVTIPDVPQQTGMTDEQIQQYKSQVDSFVSLNEKVEIPIGDQKFNFGLKDYKETLKKDLLNPFETLKKHGIDIENGLIDSTKLGKLLIAAYVGDNVGKPLSDWSIDAKNIELLKNKLASPAPAQPIAAGAAPGADDDMFARFGKGMAAAKEAQRQSQ